VTFAPVAGSGVSGACDFTPTSSVRVQCRLQGLTGPAVLIIPLADGTVATLGCTPAPGSGSASCGTVVRGGPLVGGVSAVRVGGQLVAQGVIVPGAAPAATPTAGAALAVVPAAPPPLLPPPVALLPPPSAPAGLPPVGAAVPLIPEADSLGLLALGALGLAVGWALRRRW
jgi:hypothetical protein